MLELSRPRRSPSLRRKPRAPARARPALAWLSILVLWALGAVACGDATPPDPSEEIAAFEGDDATAAPAPVNRDVPRDSPLASDPETDAPAAPRADDGAAPEEIGVVREQEPAERRPRPEPLAQESWREGERNRDRGSTSAGEGRLPELGTTEDRQLDEPARPAPGARREEPTAPRPEPSGRPGGTTETGATGESRETNETTDWEPFRDDREEPTPPAGRDRLRIRDEAPAVRTFRTVLPAGTRLDLALLTSLASDRSEPGDRYRARLARDVRAGGMVALAAGTEAVGSVTGVRPADSDTTGVGHLELTLLHLVVPDGSRLPVTARTSLDSPAPGREVHLATGQTVTVTLGEPLELTVDTGSR